MQGKLEQAMNPDLRRLPIEEIKRKLSRLKSVKGLADGGAKSLAQCQSLEAEMRRREEETSKGWLKTVINWLDKAVYRATYLSKPT